MEKDLESPAAGPDFPQTQSTNRVVRSLWHKPAFLSFWLAFTLSEFGSSILLVMLPILAVTLLHAVPLQMSVISTANTLPFLFLGPLAGVMADRLPRRRILIGADMGRAIALATGVVLALSGTLTMTMLIAIAFAIGIGNVWFDIAYGSYVPSVVARGDLVAANSHLSASQSIAETAGPAGGGSAIQFLSAPIALLATSVAYAASAVLLSTNRGTETVRKNEPLTFALMWSEVRSGILFIWKQPLLRILFLRLAAWHLTVGGFQSLIVFFLLRELHLPSTTVGALLSLVGVGTMAAAFSASRVSAWFGIGPTILACNAIAAVAAPLIVMARGNGPGAIAMVGIALLVFGYCVITYQINNASLRQALTPDALLGRMGAAGRVLALGANALGAIVAGGIAQFSDARAALTVSTALGLVCGFKGLLSRPLRGLRTLPE